MAQLRGLLPFVRLHFEGAANHKYGSLSLRAFLSALTTTSSSSTPTSEPFNEEFLSLIHRIHLRLFNIACDQYGNYVIQSLLSLLEGKPLLTLIADLITHFDRLVYEHYGLFVIRKVVEEHGQHLVRFIVDRIELEARKRRNGETSEEENPLLHCLDVIGGRDVVRKNDRSL